MPPRLHSADERLMAAYREAALRINRTLQDLTPRNKKIILHRIDIIIHELDTMTAEYLNEALPLHFRDGADEAVRQLKRLQGFDIDETFGTIHTEALKALADDAKLKFANGLESARRTAHSKVSLALKQQVLGELLVSEIEGASNPAERVKEIFQDEVITAFQGRNRQWSLEDYSAMLTHTILADAHNTGAVTRYAQHGVQFARIIERADAPDRTCQWMNGKIVNITDRRLLNPYHPNAVFAGKSFLPYGRLKEMVRAFYRGPARLLNAGQYKLAIGPNHPMVTRRGLVPAKFLREGDELLYDLRVDSGLPQSAVHADFRNVPVIEDSFETLMSVCGNAFVTPSGYDFHGDAEFIQSKIDVVRPDRDLLPVLDALPLEKDLKLPLARTDSEAAFEAGSRAGFLGGKRVLLTPSGGVSFPYGAPAPWFAWLPITHICDTEFHGWAFDATTSQGLYSYGGFAVSNCMGGITPVTEENPPDAIMSADDPQIPADVRAILLKKA